MLLPIACAVLVASLDWFRLSASLPVPGSATTALFATFAFLLVAYRALNPPGDGLEPEPALYGGLALLIGIFVGAIYGMMEEAPPGPSATTADPA
jgi:hypothetical protein